MTNKEVVRLENVWVHYDGVPVLDGINLSIYEDDFLGIIGPNGGGKTTLLKVILGLLKPSYGRVSIFGDTPEKGRKHIGYVSQHSLFDRSFPANVKDVVMMGRLRKTGAFRNYTKQDHEATLDALRAMEILDYKDQQIGKLSGGQQQRVFIARALVTDPELLLLDEPTASVDTPLQTDFYELLGKLKKRMSIVLISHNISTVSVHVDKIACLNRQLYYHSSKELAAEDLEAAYQCPVEMIAHGVPHRVLKEH